MVLTALLLASGLSAGCGSTAPSRFFTLTALKAPDSTVSTVTMGQEAIVALGPIQIPDYLYRPQIMTRSQANELRMAETERWAGSLEDDVARVLVENLTILLAEERVKVMRWSQSVLAEFSPKSRVSVEVLQFEGALGGIVVLRASSTFYDGEGRVVAVRDTTVREPVSGRDYEALAGAMSRALADLSREVAAVLHTNDRRSAKRESNELPSQSHALVTPHITTQPASDK